jgi:hypothetical protein
MDEFPPLVARARAAAMQHGFPLTRAEAGHCGPSASLPGVGRFLAMLAAGCNGGRIAELWHGHRHRHCVDGECHAIGLSVEVVLPDLRNSLLVGTRVS